MPFYFVKSQDKMHSELYLYKDKINFLSWEKSQKVFNFIFLKKLKIFANS